jgi:heme exporter protein C
MRWVPLLGLAGLIVLGIGHGIGLLVAPAELGMGETGRILYAHVPCAWVALLVFGAAFAGAVMALWSSSPGGDALNEAGVEVGLLFSALLLVQGSLWARPTWGVFWTWDPRLTTTAILFVAFAGVLVLRRLVDQPERRMTTSAVATIVAFVDVPVVYFSVRWWKTLHQPVSPRGSIDASMLCPLLLSFGGLLLLAAAFLIARWRIARARIAAECAGEGLGEPPPPIVLPLDDGDAR